VEASLVTGVSILHVDLVSVEGLEEGFEVFWAERIDD
jgi:hypothetical protein